MARGEQAPEVPEHLARWSKKHPVCLPHAPRGAVTRQNAETPLDRYKLSLRRYDPVRAGLPWEMLSECPTCDAVVPSKFFLRRGQVVLSIQCSRCGEVLEAHQDVLWRAAEGGGGGAVGPVNDPPPPRRGRGTGGKDRDPRRHAGMSPDAPTHTYGGTRIRPVVHGLPRTVETLCPECGCNIAGRYYVKHGRVMIEKTCPAHGYFRDCINSDVRVYLRASYWTFGESPGLTNPHVTGAASCPSDCGLCNQHQSSAVLGNIDLTNRCNLRCSVCFANANAAGYVHEPTFEQVERALVRLLDCRPIPCTSVQFSGGEPTLHPRFVDIVRRAAELGMTNIQVATNGIRFGDLEFAQRCAGAGLHSLYLQFDGLDDRLYRAVRGRALLGKKLEAVENCRKVGMKVCLVPTVIRGGNDDEVVKIFDFAVENADVVSAISYQPVAFTGRISRRELEKKRYTLGHLAHALAGHTGAVLERDFFPLSFMAPLSHLLSAVEDKPKITCNCHSDCAFGTYYLVAPADYASQPVRDRVVPMPRTFDIPALFTEMNALAKKLAPKKRLSRLDKARIYWIVRKNFHRDAAPPGLTPTRFIQAISGCVSKADGRTQTAQRENYRTLMCAGMHFQDRYNYDVERVKRCVIHYSTPDGLYPFCTYNAGPTYRPYIEAMFSTPNAAWAETHPEPAVAAPAGAEAAEARTGRSSREPAANEGRSTLGRYNSTPAPLLSLPVLASESDSGGDGNRRT